MSKKDSPPYFLLMNDNKIWSVGPEMDGVSYVPSDAVEFRAEKGRYVCRGKAGRGTAVFDGENISAELVDLLKKLPENRVPEFVISPGDAAAFCRLRSILKQQKFFHGFRLQKQDKNEFDYQFSNDAQGSYEY